MKHLLRRYKLLLVPQYGSFGGAKTYTKELLKFYANQNYDVTVCIPADYQNKDIMNLINILGYSCYTINDRWRGIKNLWSLFPFSFLMDIMLLYGAYRKVRPDLIVVSNVSPETYLGLAFFPVPFLGVIHTYPLGKPNKLISKIVSVLRNLLMKIIFAFPSKKLLTVSEFSKYQILNSWGLSSNKVSVIHNFGGHNRRIKEHKSVDEESYILTFGHVTYYKNPLIWIKVAENVINCFQGKNVVFIWGGDGDLLEQCRKNVAATEICEHIRFIGHTSEVDSYYAIASLYFQPSTIENHGISIVEAMSYSLPCVVSNIGGSPESVEHGINGFLTPPDDIDAMSKAIIKLIDNNSLKQAMGQQSLRIFNEKFSHSIWRQKMDALYTNRIFGDSKQY
jgi:glycosyltransferase involved in cell wall biosynthesis